jgi:hypothetical protein
MQKLSTHAKTSEWQVTTGHFPWSHSHSDKILINLKEVKNICEVLKREQKYLLQYSRQKCITMEKPKLRFILQNN